MQTAEIVSSENLEPKISPEVLREIENLLGYAWKRKVLEKLKRGPVKMYELDYKTVIGENMNDIRLQIQAVVSRQHQISWIEDLEIQGLLIRDGQTLTGIGQYSHIPLSKIESEVISSLNSAFGCTMTATGVKRRMKHSSLSVQQIEAVLEGLVTKGYVVDIDTTEAGSILYTAL